MKTLAEIVPILEAEKPYLTEQFGVTVVGVFGSYVRAQEQPGSDLDLLVTFSEDPGLFKYIELENYLSDTLGIKVDLVMKDSLKPNLGKRILAEAVSI